MMSLTRGIGAQAGAQLNWSYLTLGYAVLVAVIWLIVSYKLIF